MLGTPVFIGLLVVSALGLGLGALYYFKPGLIVQKRVSPEIAESARKDPEFKKWLDLEMVAQTNKTRRMGLIFIILEAIWLVVIVSLWQGGGK